MKTLLRSLLALACLAGLTNSVQASGLVQVSLAGRIDRNRGSVVELQVTSGSQSLKFSGMVGEGTTVGDLSKLFELKLKRAGFSVTTGESDASRGPVSLFIDNVETIVVRMGGGVTATVTSTEEMPVSFRALPPRLKSKSGGGALWAYVTMENKDQSPSLEILDLEIDLPNQNGTSAGVTEQLLRVANNTDILSRETAEGGWTASGTEGGAKAIAMSIRLYSDVDWGVEMILTPKVSSR